MRRLSAGHSLAPDNEAIKGLTRLRAIWPGLHHTWRCPLSSGQWVGGGARPNTIAISAFLLTLARLIFSGTANMVKEEWGKGGNAIFVPQIISWEQIIIGASPSMDQFHMRESNNGKIRRSQFEAEFCAFSLWWRLQWITIIPKCTLLPPVPGWKNASTDCWKRRKRGSGKKEMVSDDQTMKSASEVHNND